MWHRNGVTWPHTSRSDEQLHRSRGFGEEQAGSPRPTARLSAPPLSGFRLRRATNPAADGPPLRAAPISSLRFAPVERTAALVDGSRPLPLRASDLASPVHGGSKQGGAARREPERRPNGAALADAALMHRTSPRANALRVGPECEGSPQSQPRDPQRSPLRLRVESGAHRASPHERLPRPAPAAPPRAASPTLGRGPAQVPARARDRARTLGPPSHRRLRVLSPAERREHQQDARLAQFSIHSQAVVEVAGRRLDRLSQDMRALLQAGTEESPGGWLTGVDRERAAEAFYEFELQLLLEQTAEAQLAQDLEEAVRRSTEEPYSGGFSVAPATTGDVERFSRVVAYSDTASLGICDSSRCAVCLESFEHSRLLRTLFCGHSFHKSCVDEWLSRSGQCPICKANIISVP